MNWQAYNDAHSRALYLALRDSIEPVLASAASGHVLHHIELVRREESFRRPEELSIHLVLRPIGSVKVVDDYSDLHTGFRRIK